MDVQVQVEKNLIKFTNIFNIAVMAGYDGYGANIIWKYDWEHASKAEEWAIQLTRDYPWKIKL